MLFVSNRPLTSVTGARRRSYEHFSLYLSPNNGRTAVTFTECQPVSQRLRKHETVKLQCVIFEETGEKAQSIAVICNSDLANTHTDAHPHIHADTSQLSKSVCVQQNSLI